LNNKELLGEHYHLDVVCFDYEDAFEKWVEKRKGKMYKIQKDGSYILKISDYESTKLYVKEIELGE
jgi:hypothetical protein